jgi:multidrug resistance efflux pump
VSEGLFLNNAISYQQTRLQGTVTKFVQPAATVIMVMLLVVILVVGAFLHQTNYTRKIELQSHVDDRHISTQVDGRVSRLWVQEGEWIEKGSVVADIAWGTKESIYTRKELLAELERQYIQLSLEKSALCVHYHATDPCYRYNLHFFNTPG